MSNSSSNNLKTAERGVWVSIFAYIILSVGQIALAQLTHSSALRANGFNNLTDILGNIAILIGLRIARIPADNDHVYGHWKIESIASLISSFIMFFVGFEVLRDSVVGFFSHQKEQIDPVGAAVAVVSAAVMIGVYFYTSRLAKRTGSQALAAASKDNLSDAATSIGTAVAILASLIRWDWLDQAMAVIIAGFILKTAYDIFRGSVFSLSDGFDETLVEEYKAAIAQVPKVKRVKLVRGRTYGSNIFLDVVVEMSPDLNVFESHEATEEIEEILIEQFGVYDVDIHVEPAPLPEIEHFANRSLELLAYEERVLNGQDLERYLSPDFTEIELDGQLLTRSDKLSQAVKNSVTSHRNENEPVTADRMPVSLQPIGISNYQSYQISRKTFLLTYQYGSVRVSSIWRRNELWYCLRRQLTEIE